jgi:hypothetical protein
MIPHRLLLFFVTAMLSVSSAAQEGGAGMTAAAALAPASEADRARIHQYLDHQKEVMQKLSDRCKMKKPTELVSPEKPNSPTCAKVADVRRSVDQQVESYEKLLTRVADCDKTHSTETMCVSFRATLNSLEQTYLNQIKERDKQKGTTPPAGDPLSKTNESSK